MSLRFDGKRDDHEDDNGEKGTAKLSQRSSATSEEKFTTPQEDRLSNKSETQDKEGTRMSHSLEQTHSGSSATAEAANGAQPLSAAGPLSAQSFPLRTPWTVLSIPSGQSPLHEPYIPSTSETTMNAGKQNNTILWVSVPSSNDAVPLKLRSCMTMSSLFDSVLTICSLAEQQDMVLGLRIDFTHWANYIGTNRSLMLKREFSESFEVFLEILDASTCWENQGRCSVAIDVVMARNEG